MRDFWQDWSRLWRSIGAQGNARQPFNVLMNSYAETHRSYHTLLHVDHGLYEFSEARHITPHPDAVEMAWWYHDAIYDTHAHDNEGRSITLFEQMAKEASLSHTFINQVKQLILITVHDALPTTEDEKVMVDVDLSILGQLPYMFDRYEEMIRREYIWVPEEKYREVRARILQGFLDRPSIYSTDFFFAKYEAQARINLAQSIANLRATHK